MAVIEFKFKQSQLTSLCKLTGTNNISVSFCSLADAGVKKFYLCGLSHDSSGAVNTNIRPIIGCPYPPGWEDDTELMNVSHADLAAAPRFFVKANILLAVLPSNTHIPVPGGTIQVSAVLDGEIVPPATGNLETFVSFIMKDTVGGPVGNPVIARPA